MHDLLVYLDSTPTSRGTRAATLELARRVGARVLGVFVIRPAGSVTNDYADRDTDPHVARTRARPPHV